MPKVGVLNRLAFDATPETTYGTAQTTPDKSWPFKGDKPPISVTTVDDSDALLNLYEQGLSRVSAAIAMGEYSPELDGRLDLIAFLAKMALGTCNTTGASSPYTHTITVKQGDTDSHTMYWADANSTSGKADQYTGVKLVRLVIRGTAGGKLTVQPTLIGSGQHAEATITMPALNMDAIIPVSSTTAYTIGGTDYLAKLLEFEYTFENSYDTANEYVAGSLYRTNPMRTGFKCSGSMLLEHDANTLMADIEAQTSRAIVHTITQSTGKLLTINVYKPYFQSPGPNGQRGKLRNRLSWEGMYSASDSKACQIIVANDTAQYS